MNAANDAAPGDDEVRRLQSFINDLISVQALPAIWSRQDASHIVGTLLDVLVSILRLDFAYARLSSSIVGPAVEIVRLAGRRASDPAPETICQALTPWLAGGSPVQPLIVPHPLGRGHANIWPFPLGLAEKLGMVICGTARTDFPTKAETILARVAVNQAVVGLQEAQLLREQKKHAAELELNIKERTGQLTAVKDELAAELTAMTGLHQLSARLLAKAELQPLLEEILDATMALLRADFGNVQLYTPQTQALEIVAHRGFKKDFLDYFNRVGEGTGSWGMALQRGERVVVEDVLTDPRFAPHLEIAAAAGFRAVQSTPLFCRSGEPIGMISTHFRQPHRPLERELRLTDLYARQAVELIERRRAEEALRASEEHFRHLVEGVKDYALYMVDPDGRVVTWNDGAKRMKGYSGEEILGRHISAFYEPHDIESGQPQRALTEAVATGRFEDEGWRVRKDGSRFWANVIVTALRDETGGVRGFSKMTRDMTERQRTDAALRESEARFRSYFELGLVGMAITSPAKGILEVNAELCRILGFERGELLQKTWAEMTHPNDLAADVENFNRVMAGEIDGYTLDKRWICKEGRVINSIMAAKCLRRANGSVDYFVGLVLDTTERKKTEEELHKTQAELAHVTRVTTLGELAASIAHEINQPLGAIVNNSNVGLRLVNGARGLPHELRAVFSDIVHDANRASDIVTRIRAMTRRALPEKTLLKLKDVIADVLALANRELTERGIMVRTELPEDLPCVSGDRVQLQQVLLNLVMNSIEAMSDGAGQQRVLTISAARDELAGHPAVRITVHDLGIGFPPEDSERLFESFYTTKAHGLGMGLRISRSIVEAHGGRLWGTANDDGPGATFSCALQTQA